MLGIVFTSLIDMLETEASPDFANEVMSQAKLSDVRNFHAVENYPYDDMQRIVEVLVERTGKSANALLHEIGRYLFFRLADEYQDLLAEKEGLLDLLTWVDSELDSRVKNVNPNATIPRFTVLSRTDTAMRLHYYSPQELHALAEGVMDAAAEFYDCDLEREIHQTKTPHTYEFSLSVLR
jgi:hypothetical protein